MPHKPPLVIVLAWSARWQSALKRKIHHGRIIWALDENDLVAEAIQAPDAAIIYQLPEKRHDWLTILKPLFFKSPIFIVNHPDRRSLERPLRKLGVADIVYQVGQLDRLNLQIQRIGFLNDVDSRPLEEVIESSLPWG